MRNLFIIFLILLVITTSGCVAAPKEADSAPVSGEVDNIPYDQEVPPEEMIDFFAFNMTLVNPWTPMKNGFKPELSAIVSEYCPSGLFFASEGIDELHELLAAAKADGISLTVISAWRSRETQERLYNHKITRVKNADPTLTDEQAKIEAAKVVAKPDTSEHQLGLAIDFNSVEDDFKYTKEYKWLEEHCVEYGFLLRYTAEKQDKTGIVPEPWHYRYVGKENAKLIAKSGLCLEEFIEKYNKFM